MAKSIIDGLFGKSPISPLQQHMTSVHLCITELKGFMIAIHAQDWDEAVKIQSKIGDKEGEADILKKKLRLSLPSTFMMPFSRRDLLDLLLIQDSIANRTKDVSSTRAPTISPVASSSGVAVSSSSNPRKSL